MEEAAEKKKALRKRLLAARKAIAEEQPELAHEIGRRLVEWLETRPGIVSLGLYMPIRCEPDLSAECLAWLARNPERTLALPYIEEGAMRYCRWRPGEEMEEGAFRIPVPKTRIEVVPDLVAGPCVGFTRGGYRLGYGGGWFDRMLSEMAPRPETLAISYEAGCVDGELVVEPHDIAFDWIATERGVRPAAG